MNAKPAKELLLQLGQCSPQYAGQWTGAYKLPPELFEYYREVGPDDIYIEIGAETCSIPSLAKLENQQVGYRVHPRTTERFSNWPDHWIVVASIEASPMIYCDGAVFYAKARKGEWMLNKLFDNIYFMAASLATIGLFFRKWVEVFDENYNLKSEHCEQLTNDLTELFDSKAKAELVVANLGF